MRVSVLAITPPAALAGGCLPQRATAPERRAAYLATAPHPQPASCTQRQREAPPASLPPQLSVRALARHPQRLEPSGVETSAAEPLSHSEILCHRVKGKLCKLLSAHHDLSIAGLNRFITDIPHTSC